LAIFIHKVYNGGHLQQFCHSPQDFSFPFFHRRLISLSNQNPEKLKKASTVERGVFIYMGLMKAYVGQFKRLQNFSFPVFSPPQYFSLFLTTDFLKNSNPNPAQNFRSGGHTRTP
jgi:hypothetical protein